MQISSTSLTARMPLRQGLVAICWYFSAQSGSQVRSVSSAGVVSMGLLGKWMRIRGKPGLAVPSIGVVDEEAQLPPFAIRRQAEIRERLLGGLVPGPDLH